MTSEHDTVGITAKLGNVVEDPLQSLVDIEDAKVLRLLSIDKLGRVGVCPKTFTSIEANEDNSLASEILSDVGWIAA